MSRAFVPFSNQGVNMVYLYLFVSGTKALLMQRETWASGRGKTLFGFSTRKELVMGKYDDWRRGETEALLNMLGGADVARAIFRGERKLVVEDVTRPALTPPSPLIGTVVRTLVLQPYKVSSVAEAIKIGKYDGTDDNIVRQFANDEVGLAKPASVILVQFDRDPFREEMLAWGKENAKPPILPKHLLAIGVQHPDEQRNAPIVELGSARDGSVLYLYGDSDWRGLYLDTVKGRWRRRFLFGFLSE
ncbi:MAG: hypothetical protein A3J93_04875 [Candidatus Magasanikbacteria bacterium RIFOXYC2_FULL_42_28]|uniref:Uncharacterized protein n=1 Tax=Candidatus Magasanikbacteria bacterium RIFOXYC2_FULL_42_28 TaxID=1798704 RepID=A0A1F6NWQ1_9BACT|nr:MAG: hypothetical protein A3J93_04875 [Candidatus Magasanikbacteria bacterium RIFOXYC2_FULL_42_28]